MSGISAQAEATTETAANARPLLNPDEQAALTTLFTYQTPTAEGIGNMTRIREAGLALATVITEACPRSADRSAAIREVRNACMTANAAIVLQGRNLP